MRANCVTIDGQLLTKHDRRVLAVWLGEPVNRHGDVVLQLKSREQAEALETLLLMLGK